MSFSSSDQSFVYCFEQIIIPTSCGLLQQMDRLWIVQMFLCSASHLCDVLCCPVSAAGCQSKRIKCRWNASALSDHRFSISEIVIPPIRLTVSVKYLSMTLFINTDSFKDFGTLIRLDCGNTHLGSNLYNSV